MTSRKHIGHKSKKIAYHMEWEFRSEAIRLTSQKRLAFNFHPLATDLKNWMQRKGQLHFSTSNQNKQSGGFTNPYTFSGAILSISYAQVIIDSVAFANSQDQLDETVAEIKRLRLYTEHVLYAARIVECFIKQLLFCTNFREGDYEKAALGALLSKDCTGCRDSHQQRHRLSLLGSLAHRYHLCNQYEQCLFEHLKIVNRRRNVEAGHSVVGNFEPGATDEAKKRLTNDGLSLGRGITTHASTHLRHRAKDDG